MTRSDTLSDWVVVLTFDVDATVDTLDRWQSELDALHASIARIPGHGIDVTASAAGRTSPVAAISAVADKVVDTVGAEPVAAEVVREAEWRRRADEPTLPELMSAAEVADELGVARQRVHQLRQRPTFPAPLAELRGGAVWDAAAIRKFAREWSRKPGRPRNAAC